MKIFVRNAYEKTPQSAAITVFIDVFRASTALACMLKNGAEIVGAVNPKIVAEYKRRGFLVSSEVVRGGMDNSPFQAGGLKGAARVIQKTGNFTEAVFGNFGFEKAVSAAFVNISAIADYLVQNRFESVDIAACGHFEEKSPAIEDSSCAEMLRRILAGDRPAQVPYFSQIARKIEKRKTGNFSFPEHYWRDLEIALKCDSVPIVPIIKKQSAELIALSGFEK